MINEKKYQKHRKNSFCFYKIKMDINLMIFLNQVIFYKNYNTYKVLYLILLIKCNNYKLSIRMQCNVIQY